MNQLQVFALLAYYLLEVRGERGPMVKSVTTTSMVKSWASCTACRCTRRRRLQVPRPEDAWRRTRHRRRGVGRLRLPRPLPERDGMLSGLYILDLMAQRGKTLPELIEEVFAKVGPHYYDRIDITMTPAERDRIAAELPSLELTEIAGLR